MHPEKDPECIVAVVAAKITTKGALDSAMHARRVPDIKTTRPDRKERT
jgi:hypothetical protein